MEEVRSSCCICGAPVLIVVPVGDVPPEEHCSNCKKRYPPSLLKAVLDSPFSYALKLRTGELIEFSGAKILGEFVHLETETERPVFMRPDGSLGSFERGIDVRVSEIVWCADCPRGS